MADENYTLPEVPVYREAIRKILNEDPVNAEEILNPLVQALLENIHFVKLLAQEKAENSALDAHTGDDTAHLTAEERTAWNGKAEGDHRHTAEDVGALASDGTAAAAAKLVTARTIRTNLASTSAVSFNGTANITPGVTGTLPIAHGGTGATTAAAAKTNLGIKDPKRTARFVVGTSTAGWTADKVDYLCDGTADQVEINAAITALPAAGGEVVILDGTYNLTGSIKVNKNNVTLSGNGQSTILKRAFEKNSNFPGMLCVTSSYNTIRFLCLNGCGDNYNNSNTNGINLSASSYNVIIGNTIIKNDGCGIYLNLGSNNNCIDSNDCSDNVYRGIYVSECSENAITGNTCNNGGSTGIFLIKSGSNTIVGNCCNNTNYGIDLSVCVNTTIIGNTCNNNLGSGIRVDSGSCNTIVGNSCCNSYGVGISILYTDFNTVIGNTIKDVVSGISMYSANKCTIIGNTCSRGTGTASDYTSSQTTISVNGNNNLIAGNNIIGKNYTNSGTSNTFANNKYQ